MDLDKINDLIGLKEFGQAKVALEEFLKHEENNVEAIKLLGLCHVNLGMFDKGKINFETVVKHRNEDASSWFYLGNCYENLNDFLHAKTTYLKVIELREDYIEAYKNLCVVYLKTKEEEKAIALATKALERESKKIIPSEQEDYTLYYLIGTSYLSLKKFKESIPYFEKALQLNPDHSQLHNNLGTAYLTTGHYLEAFEHYIMASKLDPSNSITFYNIASILQIQNKHKDACKYFEKAYEIEPLEHYLVAQALSEFKSQQFDLAIKHYKMLVSQNPEKHNFQYTLACCYEMIGEFKSAVSILEQLVILNPKSAVMAQKLANLYIKTGQPQMAKEVYERIISKGIVSAEIYYEYALICVNTNDIATAEAILKKVIELDQGFAAAHKDLGVIYLSKRLFDYAKDEFEKAYDIAPKDGNIIFEYANFLHATSNFAKAQELYDKALLIEFENPNVLALSALNLIQLKDLNKALIHIEQAFNLVPENEFILFTMGKINYLLKNFEQAELFLEKACEKNPTIEVKNLLGLNYFEQEKFEKANELFLELIEKSPMNTNLLLNSAKCYEKSNDLKAAQKQLKKALKIFPEVAEAKLLLKNIKKLEKQEK